MSSPHRPPTTAAPSSDQLRRQLLAVALLLPALGALTFSYARPTLWTVATAFQSRRLLNRAPEWVGFANLRDILDNGWLADAGYALSYAAAPAAALVTLAPALAWLARRTGAAGRRIVLVAVAVPLACFAPVATAAAWRHLHPGGGARTSLGADDPRVGYWIMAAIVAVAAAATVGLMVQRGRAGRRTWPAIASLTAVGVLAAASAALQEFTYPWLAASSAAPGQRDPRGPAAIVVQATTTGFDLGIAAAAATLLLLPLLLLGTAAAVLVVVSRIRAKFDVSGQDETVDPPRWWAVAGSDAVLLAMAAGLGYLGWTMIRSWGDASAAGAPLAELIRNGWAPPLLPSVLGVGFAAAAGLAIGGLRPLGKHSELLLLPFAPWLFVGATPLLPAAFADALSLGRIGTPAALAPASWLSVPAVFIFTVLFAGLHREWRRLRSAGLDRRTATIVTHVKFGLPAVLVVTVAVWLIRVQTLSWPLVAGDERFLTAATQAALSTPAERPWLSPLLLPAIPALAAFVFAQLYLTRRLSLHPGDDREPPTVADAVAKAGAAGMTAPRPGTSREGMTRAANERQEPEGTSRER